MAAPMKMTVRSSVKILTRNALIRRTFNFFNNIDGCQKCICSQNTGINVLLIPKTCFSSCTADKVTKFTNKRGNSSHLKQIYNLSNLCFVPPDNRNTSSLLFVTDISGKRYYKTSAENEDKGNDTTVTSNLKTSDTKLVNAPVSY